MEPWIETASGKEYWFLDSDNQENICIEDIAAALSKCCRFTGHTKKFYSVAEHSFFVSLLVPDNLKLAALLHDASEAYLSDIASPVKQLLPEYKILEEKIMSQIASKFKLPNHFWILPEIKEADKKQLHKEAKTLLSKASWAKDTDGFLPACLDPTHANELFLHSYDLFKGI